VLNQRKALAALTQANLSCGRAGTPGTSQARTIAGHRQVRFQQLLEVCDAGLQSSGQVDVLQFPLGDCERTGRVLITPLSAPQTKTIAALLRTSASELTLLIAQMRSSRAGGHAGRGAGIVQAMRVRRFAVSSFCPRHGRRHRQPE
jgi:hypothetical protein